MVSAYAELFRSSVRAANGAHASDIHIEPKPNGVDIRFRVSGEMQAPWKQVDADHKVGFLAAVKKEAGLQIGVSGRPQDGRCAVTGVPIDLRVSLIPTIFGEKIVLRLLNSNREFSLACLSLAQQTLGDIEVALKCRNGVILISGPTGSGKTTTLYSMLGSLDTSRMNIITLEDPVEYTVPGVNQVRVSPKVSFGSALRAVLRQDPDVILVGEIRDDETAQLAFRAASTGHLVLSTVHANGAIEVVGRLKGLGLDRMTLAENLRFSAAQRLIARLCQQCSIPAPQTLIEHVVGPDGATQLPEANWRMRSLSGCQSCHSGLVGRRPVIEYLDARGVRRLLEAGESYNECTGVLKQSLRDASLDLAKQGSIDIREVTAIA